MKFFQTIFTVICIFWGGLGHAQEGDALARIHNDDSYIVDKLFGGVEAKITLSQPIPYRVFTLADPSRVVFDFRQVDWTLFDAESIFDTKKIVDIRYGLFRPGWSRLVLELAEPLAINSVEMDTQESSGRGVLTVEFIKTSTAEFEANAGAPLVETWELEPTKSEFLPKVRQIGDRPVIVVIDPGHGGIDPGAERDGYLEKDLVLQFARELKEVLVSSGRYSAHLTRNADEFVSLRERISRARKLDADILISLHADTVTKGDAEGTTIYTLSNRASDESTAQLAASHDRADLLSGVDLTRQDDQVASVLMDMARLETTARSDLLAEMVVNGIAQSVGRMRAKPHLSAGFRVLKAPDIPSILVELGFMSNNLDLHNLLTPRWRQQVIEGMLLSLDAWVVEDAAQALLLRQ